MDTIKPATKYDHSAKWKLVFYHNSTGIVFFDNVSDAKHCVNHPQKYSILGEINNSYKINGKFEFLLEYPLLSNVKYNQWRQTMNPVETQGLDGITTKEYIGYETKNLSYPSLNWGGLLLSSHPLNYTLLDCDVAHENWCCAIGAFKTYKYADDIPGNCGSTSEVVLWIRIPTIFTGFKKNKISIKISLIFLMLGKYS